MTQISQMLQSYRDTNPLMLHLHYVWKNLWRNNQKGKNDTKLFPLGKNVYKYGCFWKLSLQVVKIHFAEICFRRLGPKKIILYIMLNHTWRFGLKKLHVTFSGWINFNNPSHLKTLLCKTSCNIAFLWLSCYVKNKSI